MKKLFSFLSENKNLNYLLICAFSIAAFTYLNFDINNQFFFRDNIQRTFIYLTGIALITGLSCLFMKNISIIKIKLAALVANILLIPLFMIFIDNAEILNLPVYYIFNIHFIQTIIKNDNSPFWLIGTIIILAVAFGIRAFYFSYISKDKLNTNQQILLYGLLTYLILIPSIWVFTHFTYVSSNFFYLNTHINTISSLMNQNKFENKNIKYFNNFYDLQSHYLNEPKYSEHKKRMLKNYFTQLETYFKNQFQINMGYYDVKTFNDWVDFTLNQSHIGKNNSTFYFYSLYIPEEYDSENLSHVVILIKPENNQLKSYLIFDPSFKALNKNFIFNTFYILFHIVYLSLWFWLIRIHKKIKK